MPFLRIRLGLARVVPCTPLLGGIIGVFAVSEALVLFRCRSPSLVPFGATLRAPSSPLAVVPRRPPFGDLT